MADFYMDGEHPLDPLEGLQSQYPATTGANARSPFSIFDPTGQESNRADETHPVNREFMMERILDVFQLDEETPEDQNELNEEGDDDLIVDLEDQNRRTEKLRGIASTLDQMWWSNSEYLAMAAEKLADGSRDPRWRLPIGKCGLLDAFLMIVETAGVQQALLIHALRLIGNSCADTDENRARVVARNSIPAIITLLQDTSLLPFVVPVLFNICVDYEPAQLQASNAKFSQALVDLVSSRAFDTHRAFLVYICRLLDLLIKQPNEPELAPENIVDVLLTLASSHDFPPDLDDFITIVSTAISYLQHVRFQRALCQSLALDKALRLLLNSYTRLEDTTVGISSSPTSPDEDNAKILGIMRSNMNQVLSDVSALPEFLARCPVISPLSSSLRRWLSSPQLQLQVCACIMLGNIARSDSTCEEFVLVSQVHKPLIAILTTANDSQLLHAALGFLKNLALPAKNKTELGEADLIAVLPRLWTMDALPQIQFSSISLGRQLLIGNIENVGRVNEHLSPDPDSPAYQKSYLSLLISVFQRTDAEPVKMEIARFFTTMCREFSSPTNQIKKMDERRKQFFERHPDVGRPLSFMISQKKWPVVRSEGWFVLALMARTPDGAQCVADIMHDINVFRPLVELLTGKSIVDGMPLTPDGSPVADESTQQVGFENTPPLPPATEPGSSSLPPGKEAEMMRIDRENALVLVSELLRHRGTDMATMRRSVFEDLLKGGGNMHLSYQQAKEREATYDAPFEVSTEDDKVDTSFNQLSVDVHEEMFD